MIEDLMLLPLFMRLENAALEWPSCILAKKFWMLCV
jgi:hypothetical protein